MRKIDIHKIRLRNRVLFEFIDENFSIVIILLVFALLGYWIWQTNDTYSEFGQNFLSEMLGVLITILIINQLIVIREEKRKLPHRFAVYDDIRLFISNYMLFWQQAYQDSVPEEDPENIYTFFSEDGMGKIWDYLYLKAQPKSAIPCCWYEYMIESAIEFRAKGDKILTRHSKYLPPQVYRMIHQITEAHYLDVIVNMPKMKLYAESHNIPKINVLDSYAVIRPNDKDYAAIIGIFEWCDNIYKELSTLDKSTAKVNNYFPKKKKVMPPHSMIPKDIFEKESELWMNYLKQIAEEGAKN
jgi:hypothetical protein